MRPRASARILLLAALAAWTLLPFTLFLVVSLSGGWRFPSILGADPGSEGLGYLIESGSRLGPALAGSVGLAVGTGAIAAAGGMLLGRAIAGLSGWRRALGAMAAFLPVAAPPIALGVGLQYSFLRLGLGGSATGVLLAHLVPALGYTALFFLGIFAVFDREIEAEARRLGATSLQTFARVTLPLLRRPLAEAFVLGFLVSWAQVPLTLLVGQGRVRTLTVEVLAWIQAGQDPLAAAGSLLLVMPPLLLMAVATLAFRRAEVVAP